MTSPTNYHLLSTARYDSQLSLLHWNAHASTGDPSPFLLLSYHSDRLLAAAQAHNWSIPYEGVTTCTLEKLCKAALADLESVLNKAEQSCRIRILLSHAGALSVSASPATPLPIPDPMAPSLWMPSASSPDPPSTGWALLRLHMDTEATPPSLFTRTKTTYRDPYSKARERLNIPPLPTTSPLEVILYNEHGDIMETSIRNLALLRRQPLRWVTPAVSSGCLPGVIRRWLLEQGRISEAQEGELRKDDVIDGEYVLTFNGVEGCRIGRISLKH